MFGSVLPKPIAGALDAAQGVAQQYEAILMGDTAELARLHAGSQDVNWANEVRPSLPPGHMMLGWSNVRYASKRGLPFFSATWAVVFLGLRYFLFVKAVSSGFFRP